MNKITPELQRDAEDLLPLMQSIKRRYGLLNAFNISVVLSAPAGAIAYTSLPAVTEAVDKVITPAGLALTGATLLTGALQIARRAKASIRKDFYEAWERQAPGHRHVTMSIVEGNLKHPTYKKAENAFSTEDIHADNPRNWAILGVTATTAITYPPLAPLAYIWSHTLFEKMEAGVFHFSAKLQTQLLTNIKNHPTPSN